MHPELTQFENWLTCQYPHSSVLALFFSWAGKPPSVIITRSEIRDLRVSDVDLSKHTIRIRETKNQRERVVYLSPPTVKAIQVHLVNRKDLSEYLFTRHHKPLSNRYCQSRLKTLGEKASIKVTPHQLRHTCATLLINAGMSIIALQSLLGHRHVETTLNYARLYDETVAMQFLKVRAPGR